jgi:NCAIR mutase (PurE)-related protein
MKSFLQREKSSSTLDIDNIARIDLNRASRNGFPEVIFGAGKTADHIATIMNEMHKKMVDRKTAIIATKVDPTQYARMQAVMGTDTVTYLPVPRIAYIAAAKGVAGFQVKGKIAVLCAGTSDFAIAEEAAILLELSGVETVTRLYDVGVAGLHRLLSNLDKISDCDVCIVCAGMDGALPSVVSGLLKAPVVAVPTSVGYGAAFGGVSALLTMLNSCSPGISTVNIDNGFGAAVMAFKILKVHDKS